MDIMKQRFPQLGLAVILAALLGGMWLLPARADNPPAPIALPIPAVPGVAPLPGPIVDPGTPITNIGVLKITPDTGVTGTPVTITGSGLTPGAQVTLTWLTAYVTWLLDPEPNTVNYMGRQNTPVTVSLGKTTVDAAGTFSVSLKAPDDWGGIHDIYAVVDGKQVAHGGYLITRSLTISPKSGPIGTKITVTYRGLGSSLYGSGASLLYDNHYVGAMLANWTRGTATAVIRAVGPVGTHTLTVGDAVSFQYLNPQQSPIPWATQFTTTFRVTKDKGAPRPYLDWPANIAPTLSQRTTLDAAGAVQASGVQMDLASTAGPVNSQVAVKASNLPSDAPVSFQWSTVVGNRVNCKGQCWSTVSVPLGQATPTGGSVSTNVTVPDGLGGWHVIQMLQGAKLVGEQAFFVKQSIVGQGVSSLVVKEGQPFTIHMKGIGWTQLDNTRAVDYDNSYVGYGCGFNSQGDVVFNLHATGGPGTHLIDFYPVLYTTQPSFANTPFGMVPILTYARDFPGLALGYQLPAARLAITVVK